MTIPNTPPGKTKLRTHMRRLLRDQPPGPSTPGDAIHQCIARLNSEHTIATFAALPGEVDLAGLIQRYPDHTWVYPRVDGNHLHFHAVTEPTKELQPGSHGIAEPLASTPKVDITKIDIFLCPGLAFDINGGRLGRGGGYYDRMLTQARDNALRIGICSPAQIVEDTFSETHDIAMHQVVTTS